MTNPFYFRVPFASTGDRSAIPVTNTPSGPLSFTYGYGADYSLPRSSNPAALTIPRTSFNQLMYATTAVLQQYQQYGAPWFIAAAENGGSAFSYSRGVEVFYDNGSTVERYLSLIDTNTALPTDTTKWAQLRSDYAYLGAANIFTAQQTIRAAGTPLVLTSTGSIGLKISLNDGAGPTPRGGLGATAAWAVASYLPDLTTIAGGWDVSGHLLPGAASTYDLGSASLLYRNAFLNRVTVAGSTAPTNGLYLPATNTPAIAVSGAIGVAFQAGKIGANATQLHTIPAVTSDTIGLLAAVQTLTNKTINGANNTLTVRLANDVTGILPVANGGTGQTTYTNGQLLIGNTTGNTLTKATLTAGSGITITNGAGSIQIDASGSLPASSQAQMEAATINTVAATPGTVIYHPGVPKAWVNFAGGASSATILASYNVSSVTRTGLGTYRVNLSISFSSGEYLTLCTGSVWGNNQGYIGTEGDSSITKAAGKLVNSCYFIFLNTANRFDPVSANCAFYGDL